MVYIQKLHCIWPRASWYQTGTKWFFTRGGSRTSQGPEKESSEEKSINKSSIDSMVSLALSILQLHDLLPSLPDKWLQYKKLNGWRALLWSGFIWGKYMVNVRRRDKYWEGFSLYHRYFPSSLLLLHCLFVLTSGKIVFGLWISFFMVYRKFCWPINVSLCKNTLEFSCCYWVRGGVPFMRLKIRSLGFQEQIIICFYSVLLSSWFSWIYHCTHIHSASY